MSNLLGVSAAIEAGAGLALLLSPSLPVSILLGSSLDAPTGMVLGRIAGAALLALGVTCWLARNDAQSRAATGLVAAMLLYNTATVALLAHAGFGLGLFGIGWWPAVLLHLTLGIWCMACLWTKRGQRTGAQTNTLSPKPK